jgi:hypothetical protein
MKTHMYKYSFSNNKPIIQTYFQSVLKNSASASSASASSSSAFISSASSSSASASSEEKEEIKEEKEIKEEAEEEEIDISQIYSNSGEFEYVYPEKLPIELEIYDIYENDENNVEKINPMK